MDARIELNPNEVVAFLRKLPRDFTRNDMLTFIREKGIRMIDFMYPAEDGRVKTLNFTVNNLAYAETILAEGERVDGSSLFPSFIEAGNSDLLLRQGRRTLRLRALPDASAGVGLLLPVHGHDLRSDGRAGVLRYL